MKEPQNPNEPAHQTTSSYVYISPLKDESAFKIGKANIPQERLRDLSQFHELHADFTWLTDCSTEHSAFMLESFLHRIFHPSSLGVRPNDGGTEFFQMSVHLECLRITKIYAEAHGLKFFQYVSTKPKRETEIEFNSLSAISEKIRDRRLACNLTQTQIAEKAGIALSTYRNFETGSRRGLGLDSFFSILTVLGLEGSIKDMPKTETFRQRAQKLNMRTSPTAAV